jgi:hypothetical protein
MSKIALAVGSFIVGACSILLLGSHTSISAQPPQSVPSQPRSTIVNISDAIPAVPALRHIVFTKGAFTGGTQQLDGLECESCLFDNVTFTYGGGAVRLVNPSISGPIRVELTGAAANTVAVIQYLQAIDANRQPAPINPRTPILKSATARRVFKADFITPSGTK